jgi:hypothetical protein
MKQRENDGKIGLSGMEHRGKMLTVYFICVYKEKRGNGKIYY